MVEVIVSPRAATDADEIHAYLAQYSDAAAAGFIGQLAAAFERLSTYPMIGAPRDGLRPGTRILVIDRYLLVHRLRDDRVEVITIFDGRRNPATLEAIVRSA
jgi:toxin ParE1/3/4